MAINYKTNVNDATAMAKIWYGLAGVQNPSPTALAWWTKQIQQDGSNTAYKNFSNGKGQDTQSAFDPSTLAKNTATFKTSSGLDPWQPDANTPQLAGTNTKVALGPAGGLTHGGSTGNSTIDGLIKAAVEVGAGALTGGALAPVAGALIGGIGTAATGGTFGQDLMGGLGGAAAGYLGGSLAPAGGALAGSTAVPSAATTGGLGSVGGSALPDSIPLQTGMSGGLSPSSFGAASGAVGSGGGSALSSAIPLQTGMSGGLSSSPLGVTGSIGASAPSGGGTGLLSSIGSFAKNNPNAISGALQGLGGIATSGSKNALTNAQTTALQQQTDETAYDFKRRQARDALLAPLWGSLNTNQDPFGYGKVAKNPYAPTNPSAPAGA